MKRETCISWKEKGKTKPIAVEPLLRNEQTELEAMLEASLKENRRTDRPAAPSGSSSGIEAAARKQPDVQVTETARARSIGSNAPIEPNAPRQRPCHPDSGAIKPAAETGRGSTPHRLHPEARPQRALQLQLRHRRRYRRFRRATSSPNWA